ncbi:hypothetical protein Q5752_005508 [Cryptotrichosporon argae]
MPPRPLVLLHLRAPRACASSITALQSIARPQPALTARAVCRRAYATHPSRPDIHVEAEARRATQETARESVGPFPLGVGASGRAKPWKSWKELGFGGKVARTTRQTGNLSVILVGGGLFLILTFALTTELFAKNSPSVLYSQCVDLVRSSDALDPYLLPPLAFTHTPTSSSPSRHSQPVAHAFARHPLSGRDHLVLTFFIHGRGKDEPESLGWLRRAYREAAAHFTQLAHEWGWTEPPRPHEGKEVVAPKEVSGLERVLGSLGLRGKQTAKPVRGPAPPGTYTVGEAHADYVKNAQGEYTLLSLVVDVPSSRAPHPGRAVIAWSTEADTEGLVGRRR